jgi:organic hydroperoxide reductase OsmC/OhrA
VSLANCLAASLLFALRKYKNDPGKLVTKSRATLSRNEQGRLRITHVTVDLQLSDALSTLEHADRAFAQFENFCIVTESVRQGIAVEVNVRDAAGEIMHTSNA